MVPCAVAAELEKSGVDFTTHVVGFDIAGQEDRDQLACLAENTGGRFLTAANAEELTQALETVATTLPAPEPQEIVVVPTEDATQWTFSDKLASEDSYKPTMIQPMEVLEGRIGKGFSHYWQVRLEPGVHKVVFDAERADGKRVLYNSLGLQLLTPNNVELVKGIKANGVYTRDRFIRTFQVDRPTDVKIAIGEADSIMDYHLGVVSNEDPLPVPYFAYDVPIQQVTLGERNTYVLDESNIPEAWYRIDLRAKDYEFFVEMELQNNTRTLFHSADVSLRGLDGEVIRNDKICRLGEARNMMSCGVKLSLARPQSFLVKYGPKEYNNYIANLTIREAD